MNSIFITNFRKEDFALYEQAILELKNTGLYISQRAYDALGRDIPDCFSLRQKEGGPYGLSEFWKLLSVLGNQKDAGAINELKQ